MKTIAISACLLGEPCRYDTKDNKNENILALCEGHTLLPFCPEAYAFGTPRPTMDLRQTIVGNRAISNTTGKDLSEAVLAYAKDFFDQHSNIDLFIGKDRSPSCGVCSAKLYNKEKVLMDNNATGLMAQEAIHRKITCIDAENFKGF